MAEANDPCNVLSITEMAEATLEEWFQGYIGPLDDGTQRRVRYEGDGVYRFEDTHGDHPDKRYRVSVRVEVVPWDGK